jgi:hypothetical protein
MRVAWLWKLPSMELVTALEFCFSTPRITKGIDLLVDGFGDLGRQPLLDLQPPAVHFHQARNFAQSDDLFVGNVCHVTLAEKGQEVVLAQAEEIDIRHDHHLIVLHFKQRVVEHLIRILSITARQEAPRAFETVRRPAQAVSLRILSDLFKHCLDQVFHQRLDSARQRATNRLKMFSEKAIFYHTDKGVVIGGFGRVL